MLRLCIDARMAFCSGIGTYIRNIVPFFQKSSFEVTLLTKEKSDIWPVDCKQILFDAPIYSFKEQISFRKTIPETDLFWSPHYNVPLYPIRAKKRAVTIHDVCHFYNPSFFKRAYARFMIKKAYQRSDLILTVSQFSRLEIGKFFTGKKVEVLPIGVDLSFFSPKEFSEKIAKKYGLPKRFALFVGNQKPHKNIERLKRAFTQIPELPLVIFGEGSERGKIEEADLPYVYSMAELFVFPSLYEGFGLPPLEAMSCGCPVALSDAASIPEVCGDAGLYFNPSQENQMIDAVKQVLSQRKDWVQKGLKRVKMFDWKSSAEKHIALFERILHA